MAEPLNPLTLPLQGSRLIEASAGTGKTWTIAALYLRGVLGHGGRALAPGEILVMSFTKAATRELAERIRARLIEAAAHFRGQATDEPDALLTGLLQAFPAGPAREQAAWRLALAADAMDEAAVHTIDAWCQRMLREHAFDSASPFDEQLQADEAALRDQALRDYWRQQVYPLEGAALDGVLEHWPELPALARAVADLLGGKPLPAGAGQGDLAQVLDRAGAARRDALAALKTGWVDQADEMLACLQSIWQDKKHPARKAAPGEAHATRWIEALKAWARDPALERPDLTKTAIERLGRSDLQARLQAGGLPPEVPDCFGAFEALMPALKLLPDPGAALRLHAAACITARMQQLKAQAGSFGFADMLDRLDQALDEAGPQAERARRLRQRILAQYPVAIVDEFQDTSPVQLRIFDRLYRIADDDPEHTLLLIGDPKQAIYGFRGADIYSYLRARSATQGRHHMLGTNHRSTQALVKAVNTLFEAAEQRPGEGAFLFREAGADSPLPFVPVAARGREATLVSSAGELPALTLVADTVLRQKEASREYFAGLCAERIVALLNDAQAGFAAPGEPLRRLRPADVAVLVRSGIEAEAVRRAMRQRGLASVYLSDRDTVFQSAEAADLLRLLQAVAAPRDLRRARAALATALIGLSLDELLALSADDALFDRRCETLQQLNTVWLGQGVLAMLRRALHAFELPARWLAAAGTEQQGERRLTNVLHLAELLQAASAQAEGEQVLIRWLAQQIEDSLAGLAGGEERVLRLESDADLVQVVTVHKSKGLEYPLVFLPFAAHFREVDGDRQAVLLLQDEKGGRRLVLGPDAQQLAQARHERLREDLRLLYVALTRARHALWVGAAALQVGLGKKYVWHHSALGCLLSGPDERPPEHLLADLQALAAGEPALALQALPPADPPPRLPLTRLQPRAALPALLPAPVYQASFDRLWGISSYSALVRDAARDGAAALAASGAVPTRLLREDEPEQAEAAAALEPGSRRPDPAPWHRFPRGAVAGNFLHGQLEWLAGEGFALEASPPLQQALLRRCERQGWGHRADEVLQWLRRTCSVPLPALGVPLAALQNLSPELEFWFPSDGLRTGRVDALCRQHLLPGRARPALPERTLSGLLMGFADLVFEHQGRFWVLDYKSNALGVQDADYTAEAMNTAMLAHRYDVQAALYLLALHRLLKSRLGSAYRPALQLGGAVYLFLRGVNSASAGCCHLAAPPALIESLDALLPAAGAEERRA